MRALVTGATGFLGKRLAKRLADDGHEVVGVGRNLEAGRWLEEHGVRFVSADLADRDAVVKACRGQEVVFHSGALSSPWGPYPAFHRSNVEGTRNVIEGSRTHGVRRLVHVSTPSLYFDTAERLGVSERDPLAEKPVNHYAATKRMAEELVDAAHAEGLPVVTIRPRALFGPGDTTILPRLIRANARGALPLFGPEGPWVDVTYVDNVVDALLLCESAPDHVLGKKYNITNGETVRMRHLLEKLFAALEVPAHFRPMRYPVAYGLAGAMEAASLAFMGGREPLLTRYSVNVLARSQTLDISAARRDLGYTPRTSLDEGLAEFVAWWKEDSHAR
jgi:nucleoside-diphosphate-sugar epimerase